MPTIIVSPLKTIGEVAGRHGAREMISLIAERQDFHRPGCVDPARHLVVAVNDIAFAGKDGLVAPEDEHVIEIIGFARAWDQNLPLLIHCWMGVSRSPAAALISALSVAPELDDDDLVRRLRAASPQATPNVRLVEIGDRLLRRNGRLVAAVKAIGRGADYGGDAPFALTW
jgi:predicted protein tyrosine phosphatase